MWQRDAERLNTHVSVLSASDSTTQGITSWHLPKAWLSQHLHMGSFPHHFAFPFDPTRSSFVHVGGNQVFCLVLLRADWVQISVSILLQIYMVSSLSLQLHCCVANQESRFFGRAALSLFWMGTESSFGRARLSCWVSLRTGADGNIM